MVERSYILKHKISRRQFLLGTVGISAGLAVACRGLDTSWREYPEVTPEKKLKLLWELDIEPGSFIVDEQAIFLNNNISRINIENGNLEWQIQNPYPTEYVPQIVGVFDDNLIFRSGISESGHAVAIDKQTGEIKWHVHLDNNDVFRDAIIQDNGIAVFKVSPQNQYNITRELYIDTEKGIITNFENAKPFDWEGEEVRQIRNHYYHNPNISLSNDIESPSRMFQQTLNRVAIIRNIDSNTNKEVWETKIKGAEAVASGPYPTTRVSGDIFYLVWTDNDFVVVANQGGLILLDAQKGDILNELAFNYIRPGITDSPDWQAVSNTRNVIFGFGNQVFVLDSVERRLRLEREFLDEINNLDVSGDFLVVESQRRSEFYRNSVGRLTQEIVEVKLQSFQL